MTKISVKLTGRLVIEPDDGMFHAYSPDFPGLHTSGGTKEEAEENGRDAMVALVKSFLKHKEALPSTLEVVA
ncbi:hypothetical protein LCGC14_0998580 [marine sediment metagenome]|uniref:HicB-like antitoxin of toxin-antitoxin system domain-containing protein n=1 Tax=marine sediment metagenome TaxID=412755 RepID=A0A0F9NQ65_9ZZZZ